VKAREKEEGGEGGGELFTVAVGNVPLMIGVEIQAKKADRGGEQANRTLRSVRTRCKAGGEVLEKNLKKGYW